MDEKSKSNNKILPRVNELTLEDENFLEQNIVWLFGSRRSGTTWLGEQLLSFNSHYLHEPDITVHLELPMAQSGKNFNRRIDARKNIEGYFFSEKYKNTWSYYLGKLILYRIYAQIQDIPNNESTQDEIKNNELFENSSSNIPDLNLSKKIIIKEPSTLLDASDIISQSLPQSKIIVMLRDGRDVIDSFVDSRSKGGWQANNPESVLKPEQRIPFIERRARLWINQTRNLISAYDNHNEKLRFLIKYEDLRYNTYEELKKMYNFIGIEIPNSELEKLTSKFTFENIPENEKGPGKRNRSGTPGKWENNFSEKEKKKMNEILMPTLQEIGYD